MKKIMDWLTDGLFIVPLFIISFLLGMAAVIYLPFDYIRYKTSRYYRDLKIKYLNFSGNSTVVRLYDAIQKAGLPLDYYRYTPPAEENEEENTTYHWFVHKDILIPAEFLWDLGDWDQEKGWFYGGPKECLGVTEWLEENLQTFAQAHPEIVCTRTAALVKRKEVATDHLSRAEQDPTLIVYDKGQLTAVLQRFTENN